MSVLVVGGTGTVGSRVVAALRERGTPVRVGARRDRGDPDHVRFDWSDPATFDAALDGADRAFLVAPVGDPEPSALVRPLLERAGLERAALLGSSSVEESADGFGALYGLLRAHVRVPTVLRPSWFLQNFTGDHLVADGIRDRGEIVSATGRGRVGFVDAGDIAAVAAHVLLDDVERPGELVLTGPEALSYDDAAELLTAAGRPTVHRSVPPAEFAALVAASGIDPAFAEFLAGLDTAIADGAEDRVTDTVELVTGRRPRGFREVVSAGPLA
ncbi:NAD-dependent epimerase/dehydratase family protein [Pseudonocardia nematodicida]|uniref:NAD-dependent epimerase/dehydratase family protein n=1 Tax=Pseudonocardia nematodicida TaxID=1206997 RepID=A0ABV1KHI7_9PSEU